MKKLAIRLFLFGSLFLALLVSCRNSGTTEEIPVRAVVPVTITTARTGMMTEYTELPATSSFLQKAVIKSPVTGYVEQCLISAGDRVANKSLLFVLRTKEATVLQQDSSRAMGITGLIKVKASMDGVISQLDHPKGDFVQEGDALCSLVLPESLVFILEIPFEMKNYIRPGDNCMLHLPDNETISAVIRNVLPVMTGASQTQRVVLSPSVHSSLPENLIARVRINRSVKKSALILPKSSVLSDEVMKNFWVMQLVSDTLAVKVPVKTGISGVDSIEIVSPAFTLTDRFITSGNYGLGDTVVVRIIK